MRQRLLTFDAAFPDDSRHSAAGDVVTPGGRAISERLRALLEDAGPCEQHSFYGWAFSAGGCRCLLQFVERWLLIVEDQGPLFERWFFPSRSAKRFEAGLSRLSAALDAESRYSNPRWVSRQEYERLDARKGRE